MRILYSTCVKKQPPAPMYARRNKKAGYNFCIRLVTLAKGMCETS